VHADSAYIDTSVLGAYYCPDPLSDAAEGALLQLREPFISSLTEVEFASLVARKGRLRELSDRQAGEILRRFGQHVTDGHYRRLPLGNEHLLRARDLIASMASTLSALDALHLAVAMAARIPVLTADRAFARAVRRHGAAAILVK
jgi:predicted nucleic acid-binding protein